jgi:hypothetical protein
MMRRRAPGQRLGVALLGVLALLAAASARPRAQPVDLLLVLAVDTSGSVDTERFELQKQGYVAAFRNPRLVRAIQAGPAGAIGVTMTQWTGPAMQLWVTPWMRVSDAATAGAFADAVAAVPRRLFGGGTSISGAIDHAAALFGRAPFDGARRVIDVSGDGANNRGNPAPVARDAAVAAGITVNGLPILALEPDVDVFYRDNVIGGPGAFLIVAKTFDDFADAVLRKLIAEIAAIDPDQGGHRDHMGCKGAPAPAGAPQEGEQCPIPTRPFIRTTWTAPGSSSPMVAPPVSWGWRPTIRTW